MKKRVLTISAIDSAGMKNKLFNYIQNSISYSFIKNE